MKIKKYSLILTSLPDEINTQPRVFDWRRVHFEIYIKMTNIRFWLQEVDSEQRKEDFKSDSSGWKSLRETLRLQFCELNFKTSILSGTHMEM